MRVPHRVAFPCGCVFHLQNSVLLRYDLMGRCDEHFPEEEEVAR